MINAEDFKVGKLYYSCYWLPGKYPVPKIEAFILEKIEDGHLHFISPQMMNAKEALEKISMGDRSAILNVFENATEMVASVSEAEHFFHSPKDAIEFLIKGFTNEKLKPIL